MPEYLDQKYDDTRIAAVEPVSAVTHGCDVCDEAMKALAETVESLTRRLEPVLAPPYPSDSAMKEGRDREMTAPLVEWLDAMQRALLAANERLLELRGRLAT